LTVFFGEDCPLVTSGLPPLAKVFQSRKHFHNYTMTHCWVALTWRIHLNIRAFFEEKGLGMAAVSAIRCTTADIGSGMLYGEDILPLDFPKPHATKHQGEDSTPTGGNSAPRPDGAPPMPKWPKLNERVAAWGAAMSARFRPLVNQAAASVTRFWANMLWKTSEAINQMLGTKFIELLPPNKSACLRYHIFRACTTLNCCFAHELTAEPSNTVFNRIHARVKAHVEEFVVDPNRENA
jgi:hypothetical protein